MSGRGPQTGAYVPHPKMSKKGKPLGRRPGSKTTTVTPRAAIKSAIAWARAHPDAVPNGRFMANYGPNVNRQSDEGLAKMLAATKLDAARPKVVSTAQIDALVAGGAQEFYRGFSSGTHGQYTPQQALAKAQTYVDEFLHGPTRTPYGAHGSGIYAGIGPKARGTANAYAGGYTPKASRTEFGSIMRGVVAPSAKTISYDDLITQRTADSRAFLAGRTFNQLSAADQGQYHLLFSDEGRYAVSKGYDVVGGPKDHYLLILNRGAIIAQSDLIKPAWKYGQGAS